jgi:hypothetical protein
MATQPLHHPQVRRSTQAHKILFSPWPEELKNLFNLLSGYFRPHIILLNNSPALIKKSDFTISRFLWSCTSCVTIPRNSMGNVQCLPVPIRNPPVRISALTISRTTYLAEPRFPICRYTDAAHVSYLFNSLSPLSGF